jgi:hypothetical protein
MQATTRAAERRMLFALSPTRWYLLFMILDRRVKHQAIGVVHILISGHTAECRMPQRPSQQMLGVPAAVTF